MIIVLIPIPLDCSPFKAVHIVISSLVDLATATSGNPDIWWKKGVSNLLDGDSSTKLGGFFPRGFLLLNPLGPPTGRPLHSAHGCVRSLTRFQRAMEETGIPVASGCLRFVGNSQRKWYMNIPDGNDLGYYRLVRTTCHHSLCPRPLGSCCARPLGTQKYSKTSAFGFNSWDLLGPTLDF